MKPDKRNNTYLDPLTAVSPLDGRYWDGASELSEYFSEYGLIRQRIAVECAYLIALSKEEGVEMRELSKEEELMLQQLSQISVEEAREVKEIEKTTNHDVKAVEYFIKKKLEATSLKDVAEWTHFGLTSEDINSVAYGLALRGAIEAAIAPAVTDIVKSLSDLASTHAGTPMLARTHGQSASPTTFGKEMRVFAHRIERQIALRKGHPILVKFGGATGGYNAHAVAIPHVDWQAFAKNFIEGLNEGHKIKIELNPITTQIEPHDTYAELFDNIRRINTILLDLSQDMWRYISDGWLTQKAKEGEIGSSAMPHKVNPIDFENAEGNFGLANALAMHFSMKLPISRLQRDLSDSTVERSMGSALAYSLVGYRALMRGLGKISVNENAMKEALEEHPEVISEGIQTILRKEGVSVPYEKLKELTRGKKVTMDDFAVFIESLDVPSEVKDRLKAIRPDNYIGLSAKIAQSD